MSPAWGGTLAPDVRGDAERRPWRAGHGCPANLAALLAGIASMTVFASPLAALTAVLLCAAGARAAEQLVDGIAAQVGTRIVLISEVLRAAGAPEAAMRKAGASEQDVAKLRAEALERLSKETTDQRAGS